MIERKVPKDIRKYKTKVIGPLTLRQIICIGVAIIVDFLLYFVISKFIDLSINMIIYGLILIDIPIISFTFTPLNLPMEKYLKCVLFPNFIYPTNRKEKTKLIEIEQPKLSDKEKEKRQKEVKKLLKKHPEMKAYK
mgnify:CR=1 FL=1